VEYFSVGSAVVATNVGGVPAQKGVNVTLEFDSENTLSGYTGCNSFDSDYRLSGENFTVSGITSSSDSCAENVMDQESNFIITLEGAESIKLYGDNLVINSNDAIFNKLKFTKQ
jgi:putative lipoprotein